MKIISTIFLLLIVFTKPVYANELQEGINAYNKGKYTEALKKFKHLAKKGNPIAQYNLGKMYGKGQGVPEDFKEAVKWSKLSAEQGYEKGQYNLGVFYARGWGVNQSYEKAIKWWTLAANQGNVYSQFDLGETYNHGQGVAVDLVEAHKWFSLAGASHQRMKVEDKMSHPQIQRSKQLAAEWLQKHGK